MTATVKVCRVYQMVCPSGWTHRSPEGEYLCSALWPVLIEAAWQSVSLDNNTIKHWGSEKAGRKQAESCEAPVTVKDMSRFKPLVCRDTLYTAWELLISAHLNKQDSGDSAPWKLLSVRKSNLRAAENLPPGFFSPLHLEKQNVALKQTPPPSFADSIYVKKEMLIWCH